MTCRHCNAALDLPFVDLGSAPPSNAYLTASSLHGPEKWFPLRVLVCTACWLVQTEDYADRAELFSEEYAYFSSISSSWRDHAARYVAAVTDRFGLHARSTVVEVASNDGYLLEHVRARGIHCLGIEPTASTARAAREKGIDVVEQFFGRELAARLAQDGCAADLAVANNVLAHVPDVNDFVAGFPLVLKPDGVATFEFPHLLSLVRDNQFDTIYHEHFSYLSLTAVSVIFDRNGLAVFDVERLSTHGGSLRVYAQRAGTGTHAVSPRVEALRAEESAAGMASTDFYAGFQAKADRLKNEFLEFLVDAKQAGRSVAGYGAAAKANTLLNYAGVRPDLVEFVADRNPAKQGKYMPGSRIPIVEEGRLRGARPDHVILFPWNLREELSGQLRYVREWGGSLVTAVPRLEVTSWS